MGFDCGNCLTCLGVEAHDEAPVCSYGKESAQMTDSESNETPLTHWERRLMSRTSVALGGDPGYLVAETPLAGAPNRAIGWDDFFARLLNQELGVPSGWTLEWEPGACVVSRIAHVGPGLDAFYWMVLCPVGASII